MGQRPRRGRVHVSDTEEEYAASAATDEQGVEAEAEAEDETATESGHDGPTRSGWRSRKSTALAAASRAQEAAGRTAVMSREARRKAKAARTAATRAVRAATLVERLLGRVTRIHAAYSCVHPSVVAAVSTVCGACTKLTMPAVLEAAVVKNADDWRRDGASSNSAGGGASKNDRGLGVKERKMTAF